VAAAAAQGQGTSLFGISGSGGGGSGGSSGGGGAGVVLAHALPWAGPVGSTPPCLVGAGHALSLFGATFGGSGGGGGGPRATAPLLATVALSSEAPLVAATVLDPLQVWRWVCAREFLVRRRCRVHVT
jgi:hypothetical protein